MQTPDKPFVKTQEEFDALFNQLNYAVEGASGSVKDYYLENSYGQFTLTTDVVGPYTAQHNMAHCGSSWQGARQLATEAVHLADPDVDYSAYDNSGNGWVDGVYMIFAGYGEEAGGGPNTIWSHAWSIEPVQLDGVWISRYACSPELRGNSNSNMTRIGVIGHEFGHILGAPDYYDTDGDNSGGQFTGTGRWDMMAGGTWNNGGATPAHHNPYTKTYLYHWASPTTLNQDTTVTLFKAFNHSDSFYRINTNTPGEYYLLENRHQVGFDAYIPGEGLIIYHVHKEVAASGNSINVGHPQKMYPVSAGATTNPSGAPWTYGNISSAETPFPGSTNQTSFTDSTIPNALSWAGENTNKPLTNITRNASDKTVTLDFMANVGVVADWMHLDDGNQHGLVGLGGGGVYQIAQRFEPEDMVAYQGFQVSNIRVFTGNMPTSAAIKIWQGESQESLVEVLHQSFTAAEESWVTVALNEPLEIDPALELWFGAEYDDPGAGVFTASRDIVTDHNGKGNLIRMDITDHAAWVPLSDYNIVGDWNIQARVVPSGLNVIFFSVTDGQGGLAAELNGAEIYSGDGIPDEQDLLFTASPDSGFGIKEWTVNGEVVDGHQASNLELSDISGHIYVEVAFYEIFHLVDFYVEGNNGTLTASVDNNGINSGDEIQAGRDILFTANPDAGFRVKEWTLNGAVVDGATDLNYEIIHIDKDLTVTVAFEEAVSAEYPETPKLLVYPNPARSLLAIESNEIITRIRLIDISGQILKDIAVDAVRADLNVHNFNNGVYLLQVRTMEGVLYRRIQIVK